MSEILGNTLSQQLVEVARDGSDPQAVYQAINGVLEANGYTIAETNQDKPWGAYTRLASDQADRFLGAFPFGVSPEEARMGMPNAELSPKILAVAPGQRLSWQYHSRRAERWVFLTPGAFRKSSDDEEGELLYANAGDVIQFEKGERHRLEGLAGKIVLVAEVWQHTDPESPSDEDDIVRLADDYQR